ncbi:probable pectinesterase 29 [Elaeis guineensis]|uniref:Pectinesterase n=1 Tax=Elaeis guineensis var. tenera TaxID=51953 RepID=A0A6I9S842_ELAGV|nr:probable pectinesterase 29 [Elaeis guineensis]
MRIHVVAGIYREKVHVSLRKAFILLEGEGHQQTSIEWDEAINSTNLIKRNTNLSSSILDDGDDEGVEGVTFTILADNYVVKDIAFKNTYDHKKNGAKLATAALVGGDKGSFYRCAFFAYQNTLNDYSDRHYFEECQIEGAIDFIFGKARSIYANSTLHSIMEGSQPGWITKHARFEPDLQAAYVFKYCTVDGAKTFLGRPGNSNSTVVFYETYMADNVVPEGWDVSDIGDDVNPTTFAEDSCSGPGSDTTHRVKWEKKLSPQQLENFISIQFIDQEGWLSQQP